MKNTTVYLVRHAEVNNPKRIIYGRLPGFGLSKLGFFQSQKLKNYFSEKMIDTVYASPLLRARETAEIIAGTSIKVNYSPRFTEVDIKKWEGKPYDERTLEDIERYVKDPDSIDFWGETLEQVQVRMVDGIFDTIKKHLGKKIVIISHADPIITVDLYFKKKPLRMLNKTENPNGSIYSFCFDNKLQCRQIELIRVAPAKKDWP